MFEESCETCKHHYQFLDISFFNQLYTLFFPSRLLSVKYELHISPLVVITDDRWLVSTSDVSQEIDWKSTSFIFMPCSGTKYGSDKRRSEFFSVGSIKCNAHKIRLAKSSCMSRMATGMITLCTTASHFLLARQSFGPKNSRLYRCTISCFDVRPRPSVLNAMVDSLAVVFKKRRKVFQNWRLMPNCLYVSRLYFMLVRPPQETEN